MGTFLAIFLVISLNQAPAGASTITIDNYVLEGVGIYPEATRFVLSRLDDGRCQLNDAHGDPWFLVEVDGPLLTLAPLPDGEADQVDVGAALGLPNVSWWAGDSIEPPGFPPLALEQLSNGVIVELEGMRAGSLSW